MGMYINNLYILVHKLVWNTKQRNDIFEENNISNLISTDK